MTGRVAADLEVRLSFPLRAAQGWRMIEAVLDTGFSEVLTLPAEMASGLDVVRMTEVELADGSFQTAQVVQTRIEWNGEAKVVRALVLGTVPLIGVSLLRGSRFVADFVPGGPVAITPLDASQ